MIEYGNGPSHADHGKDCPHADTHKISRENKTQDDGNGNIGQVETVLRKSNTFMNGLRPLQERHDCGILISVAVHGYACTVFFFKEVKL